MRASVLRLNSTGREFESMYRRHVKDVYRYSLAMLDRPADAEDATQTTFLNAYRALERGERPRDARSWLRAIALNVCREHYRRASRRPDEVSLDDDPGELVLDPATPAIGDVIRGLAGLPFNQRAALVMREFEGRSLAEIAVALGVSHSAVEALLFRGRRALREQLEGTLSCAQAEHTISRQLDGALPRADRGPLRAHLRSCPECASLARRLRAQRSALRSLAFVPVPASLRLSKLLTGGSVGATAPAGVSTGGSLLASLAGSVAAKVSVAAIVGAATIGAGYASLHHNARPAPDVRPAASTAVHGAAAKTQTAAIAARVSPTIAEHFPASSLGAVGSGSVAATAGGSRARPRSRLTAAASTAQDHQGGVAGGNDATHGHGKPAQGGTPSHARGHSGSSTAGRGHGAGHATGKSPTGTATHGSAKTKDRNVHPSKPSKPASAGPKRATRPHPSSAGRSSTVSHGNGAQVSKGNGAQVSKGNGAQVSKGNGAQVSKGNGAEVGKGNGAQVSNANPATGEQGTGTGNSGH